LAQNGQECGFESTAFQRRWKENPMKPGVGLYRPLLTAGVAGLQEGFSIEAALTLFLEGERALGSCKA
jgi:hypothetical protein